MIYKQEAPFCVQVEMTTGCNLQCSFCGINGFQDKPGSKFNFMTLATADNIAKQISEAEWNSRIEFAMHGEPTMNPNWVEITSIFRKHLPKSQLMITSNGGKLLKGGINNNINKFFEAGGNIMAIDMYEHANFYKRITSEICELGLDVPVYNYPSDKRGNPHRRSKDNFVSLVQDISISTKGVKSDLENHAGSASELDYSRTDKPCVKPFREIGINSDGSVDICCNDWLGELTVGNINITSIDDIWHSDEFYAMRRMLMGRDRVYRPCLGCSDMGYRVGLLPDKLGKVKLEPMDDYDRDVIEEALAKGPSRKPRGKTAERLKNIIYTKGL